MTPGANGCAQNTILCTGPILMAGNQGYKIFEEKLQSIARNGKETVVIDFSECYYIDSRAIAVIISMNRRLRSMGRQLKIQHTNQEINKLFHAIQLDRIIELV